MIPIIELDGIAIESIGNLMPEAFHGGWLRRYRISDDLMTVHYMWTRSAHLVSHDYHLIDGIAFGSNPVNDGDEVPLALIERLILCLDGHEFGGFDA